MEAPSSTTDTTELFLRLSDEYSQHLNTDDASALAQLECLARDTKLSHRELSRLAGLRQLLAVAKGGPAWPKGDPYVWISSITDAELHGMFQYETDLHREKDGLRPWKEVVAEREGRAANQE